MTSLREYFETEAGERLDRLDHLAAAEQGVNGAELHKQARALRGAAQMAGHEHAYRAALGMESALRSLAEDELGWDDDTQDRIRRSIADLRRLVAAEDADEAEACVAAVLDRCLALGIEVPDSHSTATAQNERDTEMEASRAFRAFAHVEVASIADTIDAAIESFAQDPMDREALKRVLRRQRALLGSARLDAIPILGETLHAIEDLAAVIAKINVPVKAEWLDVFRTGRDVLRDVHERLGEDEEPRPINALSRLRTLRDELLDRYGTAESVSTAAQPTGGLVQAVRAGEAGAAGTVTSPTMPPPAEQTPAGSAKAVQAVDARSTLERAHELRARIESAVRHDAAAQQAVAELFELIRNALE